MRDDYEHIFVVYNEKGISTRIWMNFQLKKNKDECIG